jgi:hypothetical protein
MNLDIGTRSKGSDRLASTVPVTCRMSIGFLGGIRNALPVSGF